METQFEPIQVECYAGYKANESPQGVIYQGRRYNILKIIDRWHEGGIKPRMPQLDYYKIKADNNRQYIIRYNRLFGKWALVIQVCG